MDSFAKGILCIKSGLGTRERNVNKSRLAFKMAKCVVSAFMEVGEYMEGQETKRRKSQFYLGWTWGLGWGDFTE